MKGTQAQGEPRGGCPRFQRPNVHLNTRKGRDRVTAARHCSRAAQTFAVERAEWFKRLLPGGCDGLVPDRRGKACPFVGTPCLATFRSAGPKWTASLHHAPRFARREQKRRMSGVTARGSLQGRKCKHRDTITRCISPASRRDFTRIVYKFFFFFKYDYAQAQ